MDDTPSNRWLAEAGTAFGHAAGNAFGHAAGGRAASYDDRWEQMATEGKQVHGEVDLVESLCPSSPSSRSMGRSGPSSRSVGRSGPARPSVLDAGCGTGRVAIELARRGLDAMGVDIDPAMLARARAKAPELTWVQADLAALDLGRDFDLVVAAGNVMIYLAPGSEGAVVSALARHLSPGGLLVAGFQLDPGDPPRPGAGRVDLATYDAHTDACGLELIERWATWDRQPYADGPYAVSVHRLG